MSIIITGLEMPTERESFNLTIKYNGTVLDTETGMQVAEAHELQPHGKLIDADEFDERIRQAGGMCEEELTEDFKDGVQTVLAMLKTQTTIIPANEEGM